MCCVTMSSRCMTRRICFVDWESRRFPKSLFASYCYPVILGVWGMCEAIHPRAQNCSPGNITAYLSWAVFAQLSCFQKVLFFLQIAVTNGIQWVLPCLPLKCPHPALTSAHVNDENLCHLASISRGTAPKSMAKRTLQGSRSYRLILRHLFFCDVPYFVSTANTIA